MLPKWCLRHKIVLEVAKLCTRSIFYILQEGLELCMEVRNRNQDAIVQRDRQYLCPDDCFNSWPTWRGLADVTDACDWQKELR